MYRVEDGVTHSQPCIVLREEGVGEKSSVTIVPSRGALTTSWVAHGREWLYLDEATLRDRAKNVRGGIPVLFPSPGKLANNTWSRDGRGATLPQHGFARTQEFREIQRNTDSCACVELELRDNEATRSVFPWSFCFRLRFVLRDAQLSITAEICNLGGAGGSPMPFALGYHPYFYVKNEDKKVCRVSSNATRAWDNVRGEMVAYREPDFSAGEIDLHLYDHTSGRASVLVGNRAVSISGDFSQWVLWTLPERDFVCVEPWSAPFNALNTGEKLTYLAMGETHSFQLEFRADARRTAL
jgi:galactose mutarotase-like enzyme